MVFFICQTYLLNVSFSVNSISQKYNTHTDSLHISSASWARKRTTTEQELAGPMKYEYVLAPTCLFVHILHAAGCKIWLFIIDAFS